MRFSAARYSFLRRKFLVYGSGDLSKHACPNHFAFPPNLQPRENEIVDAVFQSEKSETVTGALVDVRQLQTNPVDFLVEMRVTGLADVNPLEEASSIRANPRTECNNVTCPATDEITIRQPHYNRAYFSGCLSNFCLQPEQQK
jgi:hypothetical protein